MDPREFDRRVLDSIDHIFDGVTAGSLERPTPCTGGTRGDALGGGGCGMALGVPARWRGRRATWGAGGPCRRRVPGPDDAPAYQRLMGYLGRSPNWTAPGGWGLD